MFNFSSSKVPTSAKSPAIIAELICRKISNPISKKNRMSEVTRVLETVSRMQVNKLHNSISTLGARQTPNLFSNIREVSNDCFNSQIYKDSDDSVKGDMLFCKLGGVINSISGMNVFEGLTPPSLP